MEVILKYRENNKFIDRGFLIGPYCPIYGYGAILITALLYKYNSKYKIYESMTDDETYMKNIYENSIDLKI